MRIAITGATSMLGVATIKALLKRETETIYAIVREGCQKLNRLPADDRIRIVCCGADDYASLPDKISQPCDVFYHFAWSLTGENRNADLREQTHNIPFTLDAMEAAAALRCRLFVGAGSQAEYGVSREARISPDSAVHPVQAYGIAKYAAGRLAMLQAERLNMACVWVRIFSVYGLWEKPTTLIQSLITQLRGGISPKLTEGIQTWDYLFSEDAGEAFACIGQTCRTSAVYCLGSGTARPLKEYTETIRSLINPTAAMQYGAIPYSDNSLMHLCADISALTADTGWRPETGFRAGIEQTLQFIEGNDL